MRKILQFCFSLSAPGLLAAVAAVCLGAAAVWFGSLNQDEGWYLYAAQMVKAGCFPYRDFFYTQGPAMPFVYAVLAPFWSPTSPFHGLLGGRVITLVLGFLATGCAVALVRRLVPAPRRALAGLAVFALLGCNLYHLYFTTIPKTYALGSLFVLAGFLLLTVGLSARASFGRRFAGLFCGGLSLAFATGTRISLLLILPVVGFTLLARFRTFRWDFLWYGLGGVLGLLLTYGPFAFDSQSLQGLLAAQSYHAARGGFDPFFALGSVSRLARGYAALGVVLFALAFLRLRCAGGEGPVSAEGGQTPDENAVVGTLCWMLGLGFAAVFLLQLSAPFPYDDYQVPIMGLLTVLITTGFVRGLPEDRGSLGAGWFVVCVALLVSGSSPLLQEWVTYNQDRFWSQKKEMSELAKLRAMGREIEALDPKGTTLLTQDLYLAIETGRTVPRGLEMGPFSYFPDLETDKAKATHVLNRELMMQLLASAPSPIAAFSGYAFAISAPTCKEAPFEEQKKAFEVLKKNYELADTEEKFGQNATTLVILRRKQKGEAAK